MRSTMYAQGRRCEAQPVISIRAGNRLTGAPWHPAGRRSPPLRPLAACLMLALMSGGIQPVAAGPAPSPVRPSATLPVTHCADDGSPGSLRTVIAGAGEGDWIDLTQLACAIITLHQGEIRTDLADLTLLGPGQAALTIDGNGAGRVFRHGGTGTLTLSNLTVSGGRTDEGQGGCVFSGGGVDDGSVALVDATVTGCQALHPITEEARGGGVYARGSISLTRSTVSNSVAAAAESGTGAGNARGGGLFAQSGPITLTDSIVSGNRAVTGDPAGTVWARGGGVYLFVGALTVERSVIEGNFAGCEEPLACASANGGGLSFSGSQLAITASRIADNGVAATGRASGGGVYNYNRGSAQVRESTISGNTASSTTQQARGGGLFTYANNVTVSHSTISGNTASTGGGIFSDYNQLSVINCTLSGNTAVNGGGLFLGNSGYYTRTSPMLVRNTTITANSSTGPGTSVGGVVDTHTTGGPSRFESTILAGNQALSPGNADLRASAGSIVGSANLIGAAADVGLPAGTLTGDPLLGVLQDNGGSTFTHAVLPGSPAIDTGGNPANLDFDQRGSGFPRVFGSAADIGAFELQQLASVPTVAKAFAPASITVGETSVLTITLSNGNASAAVLGSELADNLPLPMVVAATPDATTTCPGGQVEADPGSGRVVLGAGAVIPAGGSCTITASVTAGADGSLTNVIAAGALQTDLGSNPDAATAELAVTAAPPDPPTLGQAFVAATIEAGARSLLTITLANANDRAAVLTAPLTDTLPAPVSVASPVLASTTCPDAVLTAEAGSPVVTLAAGAAVPAGQACTITVAVTAAVAGVYTNTLPAGSLQTDLGSSVEASSADLTVVAAPADRLFANGFDGG